MYNAKLRCIRFSCLEDHWRSRVSLNQSWICTVSWSWLKSLFLLVMKLCQSEGLSQRIIVCQSSRNVSRYRCQARPASWSAVLLENRFLQNRFKVIIEDETGSIDTIVCGSPLDEIGSVSIGDQVVIRSISPVVKDLLRGSVNSA